MLFETVSILIVPACRLLVTRLISLHFAKDNFAYRFWLTLNSCSLDILCILKVKQRIQAVPYAP